MINLKIFVMMLTLLVVAACIPVMILSQNAMAWGQPCCPTDNDADVDVAEAAEAGNATTSMMANQTADGNTTDVQFLSIQTAQSGSLSEVNATAYTLELNNVSDSTILFSDRPERIVTTVSTNDFVGNWTAGQNSFATDAPNDALIVEDIESGELDTAIIESFDPVYDRATNSLTYTITAENATSMNMPNEFGRSTLVIDDTIDIYYNDNAIVSCPCLPPWLL